MKRKSRIYTLTPVGILDRGDRRVMAHEGAKVQKIQPHGCPRNGTMGMVYVQTVDGVFIGLVSKNSLVPTSKTAPVRDLAAEARNERSRRMFGRSA